MKKLLTIFICSFLPTLGFAGGGEVHLDKVDVDITNTASLQRGAKLFINYCLGCHSAKYMTYQRLAQDLALTKEQVENNLLFAGDKISDYIKIAMPEAQAKEWFGTNPPDLTLVNRSRGADWLYTYLRGFYKDDSRPFGVNNTVFKDVGMPHVLWQLDGVKEPVYEELTDHSGAVVKKLVGLNKVQEGTMTTAEYDLAMRDLVNFLAYAGEPGKLQRNSIGVWVILFLVLFLFLAYALKKEYWRDIH